MLHFDYAVIGSGLAGLSFALKAARNGTVVIITKKAKAESNTAWAQGGIACVTDEMDSIESHVQDTLIAGAGLCDEAVVRSIVSDGPARIRDEKFSLQLTSSLSRLVVYTPQDKDYFCVEPVSHVSNAIHMADPAAHGLRTLLAGESFEASMTLDVTAL